ncbi:hypothetical protein BVRB_2g035600 [Beta vulgaris subsp. vulgaris]|nr:hypothetical protein BVRB_2g035600 [Beta vulgaris subsp. vulgaris]
MLGTLRTRRRNPYGVHLCAVAAALLLLFSVSLLYSRLSTNSRGSFQNDGVSIFEDPLTLEFPLLQDSDPDLRSTLSNDRIDELDIIDEDSKVSNEEEILRGLESEGEENENSLISSPSLSSGYYFDQVSHVIRRAFDGQSVDEFDQWEAYAKLSDVGLPSDESRTKVAFGSDDVAVDEELRRKVLKVNSIEDALLLKLDSHGSPLREGWGAWFDAKSTFLRKDKMFKSNLELLNPLNHMLLQDPDGPGVTGLTRGDKLMRKGLINEMKKNKPLGLSST